MTEKKHATYDGRQLAGRYVLMRQKMVSKLTLKVYWSVHRLNVLLHHHNHPVKKCRR